jgi:flagellar biosynthetic protein FliR
LIAAPVIVALLLTNFVMGIISKAIPTVNIFIISFPLTIGVGFAISILAIPEMAHMLEREWQRLPDVLARAIR